MSNLKINKEDLGYLGPKTQKQIAKTMIENPKWLSVYLDCIKKDKQMFTVRFLGDIVEYTKKTFEDKGVTPTYYEIATYLKTNVCKTEDDYDECKVLVKTLKGDELLKDIEVGETTGMDALRKAETLCLLDNARRKVENAAGYNEDYMTELQEQISNLNRVSNSKIEDSFLSSLIESVCTQDVMQKVPTGIKELDEQLNGGVPKGQLGLLIAGTGVGKTTLSSIMCLGAALKGYNVLQIFFEDSKEDIARKHFARLSGRNTKELYGQQGKAIIDGLMAQYPDLNEVMDERLRLVRMENGETTVESIRNYINNLTNADGWKPDMIFIDYLSCLLPTENKALVMTNEWQVRERCMKKLETLARDLNITIWVAQQTNRYGMQVKTANDRIANVQGSFRSTQPCSFILYLDRAMIGDGCYDRANLYLDKCRGCQQKAWENIYMDNGTCQIDLSGSADYTDEDLEYNDSEGGEYKFNNNNQE